MAKPKAETTIYRDVAIHPVKVGRSRYAAWWRDDEGKNRLTQAYDYWAEAREEAQRRIDAQS